MTKRKQHSMEDDEEIVKDLVKRRGVLKGKLTFFSKFVEALDISTVTDLQKSELQVRVQKIEQLFEQFSEIQDDIDMKVSDLQLENELLVRESFENQYYSIVAKAKCILNNKSEKSSSTKKSCIKLPTISLPSFDGNYDNWLEFRDTFSSLIHNSPDMDNIQKFHYLRSSLTGNALQVIKLLEFSAENYVIAWDLLQNRYNNNRLLVHNHVKALFSMQVINKESSALIRKLIDGVLRNIRALKTLGEPTDMWDTLIVYIMVSKLDASTEREWELHKSDIQKSESNSKLTLSHLIKFLRDKADVLETIKVSHTKPAPATNIKIQSSNSHSYSYLSTQNNENRQSNSNKRSRPCGMCNANHGLYSCNAFLKLSTQDKIKV
uniref:Gag-pol polyprotein n=1 Tax=Bombyx mori TaxID=7091 RepID=A0A8R2LX87_BOMMO|nr:uncharacterized protein LOC119628871 [Bombyx mori]